MRDKTYVCVAPVGVKEVFDNKYKSTLPKVLNAALAKAIDRSSKLTSKSPTDKKADGFYLDGSLSLNKTGKGIVKKRGRNSFLLTGAPLQVTIPPCRGVLDKPLPRWHRLSCAQSRRGTSAFV